MFFNVDKYIQSDTIFTEGGTAKMKTEVKSFRLTTKDIKEMEKAQKDLKLPAFSQFILYLWDRFKREIKEGSS